MIAISIPLVPPTLNAFFGSMDKYQRNRIVKQWHKAVYVVCKQQKIKPITKYPVDIQTTTYFKRKGSKRDTSNCFAANKLVEDGLVRAGIIVDDNPKYVRKHIVRPCVMGCPEDYVLVLVTGKDEHV